MSKSIKKSMPFKIGFWSDFNGFLKEKCRHVATNIEQKSMPTSKSDFLKKPCFSLGKTMILKVRGMEGGIKNRSIIDQKIMLTCEGILASIFHRFWWIWEAKLEPSWHQKPTKNGCEKPSKSEAPRKTSWNPKKNPKRSPKRPQ